jgi:tetratricopeptide (TPR) repeat protein
MLLSNNRGIHCVGRGRLDAELDVGEMPLLQGFIAACKDAYESGIRLYMGNVNPFAKDLSLIQTDSSGYGHLGRWLRVENYVTAALGLEAAANPLLSWEVITAYRHMRSQYKATIKELTCSSLSLEGPPPQRPPETRPLPSREEAPQPPQEPQQAPGDPSQLAAGDSHRLDEALRLGMMLTPARLARESGDTDRALGLLSGLLSASGDGDLSRLEVANVTAEMALTYEMQGRLPDAIMWYRNAVKIDPALHNGYLMFARMFLGPESPFVLSPDFIKREVVRVLRQDVRETWADKRWNEVARYNMGAALFYTGAHDEARQQYADFIRAKPAPRGSADVPRGTGRVSDRIRVMTVASRDTPELGNLVASADVAGVDITVLGDGVDYTGHEVKLGLYWRFLNEDVKDDDQLVLAVDAYDVLLLPAVAQAARMFG